MSIRKPWQPRIPRPLLALAAALLPALLSVNVIGCGMAEEDGMPDTTKVPVIDPFPKPLGPKIIPLEAAFRSRFRYTEFDASGRTVLRLNTLTLYVSPRSGNLWTYAFEDSTQGYLLRYVGSSNRDSAGVWIVGTYQGEQDFLDPVPTRWLPQLPDTGVSWPVGSGRSMELLALEADYLTGEVLPGDIDAAPIIQGFQKHTAYRFRETSGDTVTIYYFRPGVGCLGFERSSGNRLIASGTLESIYHPAR